MSVNSSGQAQAPGSLNIHPLARTLPGPAGRPLPVQGCPPPAACRAFCPGSSEGRQGGREGQLAQVTARPGMREAGPSASPWAPAAGSWPQVSPVDTRPPRGWGPLCPRGPWLQHGGGLRSHCPLLCGPNTLSSKLWPDFQDNPLPGFRNQDSEWCCGGRGRSRHVPRTGGPDQV